MTADCADIDVSPLDENEWRDSSLGVDDFQGLRSSLAQNGRDSSANGTRLLCTALDIKDQMALLKALQVDDYDTVVRIQKRTKCGPVERGPLRVSIDDYVRARWNTLSPQHRARFSRLLSGNHGGVDEQALAAYIELQQELNARED